MYSHIPVLLNEAVLYLNPQPGQNFIDGTLGGGGYSMELLKSVAPDGKVLSIDLDTQALDNFEKQLKSSGLSENSIRVHGNFSHIDSIVRNHEFSNIQGIVVDIGLSSFQLDQSERGISFQKDELLDMRFDSSAQGNDARFIVNNFRPEQLLTVFRNYGEEKYARQIVRSIVHQRESHPINRTLELVEVIKSSLPKPVAHKWSDSARRVFQALRIEVNHELSSLEEFLPKALNLLISGGMLVVVSFHSLEDRIVKEFFKSAATGCVCPKDFPICQCGQLPDAEIITRKPIVASEAELENNSRSKPAKLRVLRKI